MGYGFPYRLVEFVGFDLSADLVELVHVVQDREDDDWDNVQRATVHL